MNVSAPHVTMGVMGTPNTDWITVAAYENVPGRPSPWAATRA